MTYVSELVPTEDVQLLQARYVAGSCPGGFNAAQDWRPKRWSKALNRGSARRLARRGATWRNGRGGARPSPAPSHQRNARFSPPKPSVPNAEAGGPKKSRLE